MNQKQQYQVYCMDPSQMEMTKQQIFFNYKSVLKLWLTLSKKIWWGHIDWKTKLKKNEMFSLIWCPLWLFKLCDKIRLAFCVANITTPTSFHQCLSVKPCFGTKFCQKFPCEIYFSVMWKLVAQSRTFVIYCG